MEPEIIVFIVCMIGVAIFLPFAIRETKKKKKNKEEMEKPRQTNLQKVERETEEIWHSLVSNDRYSVINSKSLEEKQILVTNELKSQIRQKIKTFLTANKIDSSKLFFVDNANNKSSIHDYCTVTNGIFIYNIDLGCVDMKTKESYLDWYKKKGKGNLYQISRAYDFLNSTIKYSSVNIDMVKYYRYESSIQYTTEVNSTGGGVNVAGAIKGSILYGAAGAVVGSQIGTETKTQTKVTQHDDSTLTLVITKSGNPASYILKGEVASKVNEFFKKLMPEKDYEFIKLNKNQKVDEKDSQKQTSSDKIDYSELIQLKKLLDDGIISAEDYEAKKKKILGL